MTPELRFEWDNLKAFKNLEKHHVAFEEAKTIFDDPFFITVVDQEHSADEERYITIGLSSQGRVLLVAHTDRGESVRIISAQSDEKRGTVLCRDRITLTITNCEKSTISPS